MAKYVQRDKRLAILLDRMRKSGAFLFLLTNSEYWYTKEVMTHLLSFPDTVSPSIKPWLIINYYDLKKNIWM